MRVTMYAVVAALLAAVAVSCKSYRQIPDDTLSDIFMDMYIQNAFMEKRHMNIDVDSVDVYAALIARYGYTEEDFKHTLSDAARRKSFRLSDIVDAAIKKLETADSALLAQMRQEELIDSLAIAVSREEVYRDSLIEFRSLADTAAMRLLVPLDDGTGKITVEYYYTLDSLDTGEDLRNRHVLLDRDSIIRASSALRLAKGRRIKYSTTLSGNTDVTDVGISFGNYGEDVRRVRLDIDSLVVTRVPDMDMAYEILSYTYRYRTMINGKEYYEYIMPAKISRPLRVPSPLIVAQCDSLVVE